VSAETIEWIAERGGYRAGVEARSDGLFQVHLKRWVPGGVPEEPADSSRETSRTILSDNASTARVLALEALCAGPPSQDGSDA